MFSPDAELCNVLDSVLEGIDELLLDSIPPIPQSQSESQNEHKSQSQSECRINIEPQLMEPIEPQSQQTTDEINKMFETISNIWNLRKNQSGSNWMEAQNGNVPVQGKMTTDNVSVHNDRYGSNLSTKSLPLTNPKMIRSSSNHSLSSLGSANSAYSTNTASSMGSMGSANTTNTANPFHFCAHKNCQCIHEHKEVGHGADEWYQHEVDEDQDRELLFKDLSMNLKIESFSFDRSRRLQFKEHVFMSKDCSLRLSRYIVEEQWGRDCGALYKYIDYIFRCQSFKQQTVVINDEYLVFHCGLQRRSDRELLHCLLVRNRKFVSPKWRVQAGDIRASFLSLSELLAFLPRSRCIAHFLPKRTMFYESLSELMFNDSWSIQVTQIHECIV